MFLYLGGIWTPPCLYAFMHLYAPRGVEPPYVPHTPLCICMFSKASTCCWGLEGASYMLDISPCMGCPHVLQPLLIVGLPVHLYVLGISACDMGNISLMLGVWGASTHGFSICFFLYILVVHYVSHIYHSYDYYSSSYGGVFWAVICFISMHRVAAPSATLSRGSLLPLSQLFPNHPIYMVGHTAFSAQQRVTQSLCLPYMMERGLFSRCGAIR